MKPSTLRPSASLAALFLSLSSAAMAHPGAAHVHGMGEGALHPMTGLDHLLAMIAVGLWAARLGGRSMWGLPLAFLASMTLGGALGMAGLAIPGVEAGVVGSVLVLGLLCLFGARVPAPAAFAVVALSAFFHGQAHGSEGAGAGYAAGFLAATAALHFSALGAALAVGRARPSLSLGFVRAGGAAIAAAGVAMILGAL